MCRMASFFHHPHTGEILVWDLNSHSETEEHFGLNPAGPYREGHYLPSGEIECRVTEEDGISQETCNQLLKSRFPTFLSFFRWALANSGVVGEKLHLNGLKELDEKGLVIPKGVKWLWLNSLETAEGLVILEGIERLSLNSLETAEGLVIPDGVWHLWLNGLKTAEGLVLPEGVKWLFLNGLKTSKGLVIPKGVKILGLNSLKTAEGLVIPEGIEGLSLNSLETAEGLKIPEGVEWLSLDGLKTAKGLTVGKNTRIYAPQFSAEEYAKIKSI